MSHTPGPWVVVNDTAIAPAGAINERVAKTIAVNLREDADGSFPEYGECQKADARLIAAAPELLRELKHLLAEWEESIAYEPDYMHLGDAARAVIAKAEGRSE